MIRYQNQNVGIVISVFLKDAEVCFATRHHLRRSIALKTWSRGVFKKSEFELIHFQKRKNQGSCMVGESLCALYIVYDIGRYYTSLLRRENGRRRRRGPCAVVGREFSP